MALRPSPLLVLLFLSIAAPLLASVDISAPPLASPPVGQAGAVVSNGDGFLALVGLDYSSNRYGLVAFDRDGRRIHDVAQFAPYGASITRLEDRYLLSGSDQDNRFRLMEVDGSGQFIRDWPAQVIPPARYQLHSTQSGSHVLLIDRQRGLGHILTSGGEFVKSYAFSFTSSQMIAGAGEHHFVRIQPDQGFSLVTLLPADGSDPSEPVAIHPRRSQFGFPVATMFGDRALLAWYEGPVFSEGASSYELRTAVIGPNGFIEEPRTVEGPRPGVLEPKGLLRTGNEAVLVMRDGASGALLAQRLDASGSPVGSRIELLAQDRSLGGGAATNGQRVLVHGTEATLIGTRSMAATYTLPAGDVRREVTSITRAMQIDPVVANDGSESLVVWREATAEGESLKARRLSTASGPIGETLTLFETEGSLGEHAIATGGGTYLVVWHHWQHLLAIRISRTGALLDQQPILVASNVTGRPHVKAASDGANFLIVWAGNAVAVSQSAIASAPIALQQPHATYTPFVSDISHDGRSYLLLWMGILPSFPGSPVSVELSVTRVRSDGTFLADGGRIFASGDTRGGAHITSTPAGSLVTIVDYTGTALGIHLDANLHATEPLVLARDAGAVGKPQFDGRHFVVAALGDRSARYVVSRVDSITLDVRRAVVRPEAPLLAYPGAPQIAASTDGTAALVANEIRGDGSEVPMERVVAYLQSEFIPTGRNRAVRDR